MTDILDYKETCERGQALADLCRSYEIGSELQDESGNLDGLLGRVLEDCERRLRSLPAPVFESELESAEPPEQEDDLKRVRSLVAFVREASALREYGDSRFSLVTGVGDLERLRDQGGANVESEAALASERALQLCSDVARLCHNINNPLTSLLGRAQMLQLQPNPSPEKLVKATEVIEESARRVAAVVQELAHVVGQSKEDLLTK